jgi:EpsI family protein
VTHRAEASRARLIVLAAVFLAAAVVVRNARAEPEVPPRNPLRGFPIRVAEWDGRAAPDLDAREARILGADEYLTRIYRQGAGQPVALFIGYYGNQRTGVVIHSPLNCLPGAGWQPVDRRRLLIDVDATPIEASPRGRRIEVNRVVIQKGEERQLAFYWYQERGRVIASEYASRLFLMLDAVRYGRTDGALVRVITPIGSDADDGEGAVSRLIEFVQSIFPKLNGYLPT